MAKANRALKKARDTVLAGSYQEALSTLEEIAEAGDHSASASLVYVYAYLHRWDNLLLPASKALTNPDAYYAANVFDETILALATAGQQTKRWAEILGFLKAEVKTTKLDKRMKTVLKKLYDYLAKKGKMKEKVFPIVEPPKCEPAAEAEHYRDAVENVFKYRPKLKAPNRQEELERHFFSLAHVFNQEEEMIRRFNPKNKLMGYEPALAVAQVHAKHHRDKLAWQLLQKNIHRWYPVDIVQLMPMEPVTDDVFSNVIDKSRCELLLAIAKKQDG